MISHDNEDFNPKALISHLQCSKSQCACQNGALVHCPAHEDKTPSLKVTERAGKLPLVHCHAGCSQEAVISALQDKGLWPKHYPELTLTDFSRAKKLPEHHLLKFGVKDGQRYHKEAGKSLPVVEFPYIDVKGKVTGTKYRKAMNLKPYWDLKSKASLYGLQRLKDYTDEIIICEGESDCLTFWLYDLPAVGLPGKASVSVLQPENFEKFETVYLWQEPDAPELPQKIKERLPNVNLKVLSSDAFKDISEAHTAGRDVPALVAELKAKADEPEPEKSNLTFPYEIMSGGAGLFATTYGEYLETPPEFLFMSYLTLLGHAVCDRVRLESEIEAPPRLYTVLLGESADTRKSTAIIKAAKLFEHEVIDYLDIGLNLIHGVGSAEGLAGCLKKNEKGLLICDELKTLVSKMKIDSSVLKSCICTLFESEKFHSATLKHKISLDEAQLSILAACTTETYNSMFNTSFLDIGFNNRLFVVLGRGEKKFAIPKPIPPAEIHFVADATADILRFVKKKKLIIAVEPEARELFEKWYFDQEKSEHNKRLDTYGHRLMTVLAVNEQSDVVTVEIMDKVLKLLRYELAVRQVTDPIDCDTVAGAMETKIIRALSKKSMTKKELMPAVNYRRVGLSIFNKSLGNLLNEGIVRLKNNLYILQN